jgi:hypothetical protein
VEDYSIRCLTQKSDKLAAISGLAGLFSRTSHGHHANRASNAKIILAGSRVPYNLNAVDSNPGEYCAGLWKNRFIEGLAWNVNRRALESTGRNQHTRPEQYCAPTWSWASIDGPVKYLYLSRVEKWKYEPQLTEKTELVEVSCTLSDPTDSLGPVTSGYAILKGPLVPVQIEVLDEDLGLSCYSQSSWSQLLPLSAKPCLVRGQLMSRFEVVLDIPIEPMTGRHTPNAAALTSGDTCELTIPDTPYYCLQLFSWQDARGMPRNGFWSETRMPPEVWFLLLKRRSDNIEAFERLGIGCWDARDDEGGVGIRGFHCGLFQNASITTVKIV